MSLDLTIADEHYNYTYNAAKMWYEIFPDDDGMVQIEGMTGIQAQVKINIAVAKMIKHEDILRKMEPRNGWGSYEGFLAFLISVLEACFRHPRDTWEASR